jgi:2-oxoglutarate ferredoxin oxidoreductase subunit alpha
VGDSLGLRVVQPVVLNPFPVVKVGDALAGARRIIIVEQNATGQLERLVSGTPIRIAGRVHRYDGRPFALDELEAKVSEVLA